MSRLALINEFFGQPPNASEHGYQIDHILEFCHWFMGALFVGWLVFFLYVLFRYHRSRHPVADHEGVTSGISTHLEFVVVLIEAVLLIGFAVPLWAKRVNQFPETRDAILVHTVGQQFNWTHHLPGPDGIFGRRDLNLVSNSNPLGLDNNDPAAKDDIVVPGELHVPVNRSVIIELSSKDVIHNFCLPHMRIAQDAIPGSIIPKGSVVVDTPEDYQAWLKERAEMAAQSQAAPPPPTPGSSPGTVPPPGAPNPANQAAPPAGNQPAPSPSASPG